MNPILTLASWEIVSGLTRAPLQAPADAVITALWRGQKRELLARAVEIEPNVRICFFRPVDDDKVGNWVTRGNFYQLNKSATLAESLYTHLSKVLRTSKGEARCGRLVALETESPHFRWAFLSPTVNRWRVRNPNGHAQFDLPALQTSSFFDLSAEAIHQELLAALEKPDSDASFALQFALLSPEQQHDRVIQFAYGGKQGLEQVMRWILLIHANLFADCSRVVWRFHIQIPHVFLLARWTDGSRTPNFERCQWLEPWETTLRAIFGFKIEPQLLQKHRSVQELAEGQVAAFGAGLREASTHETLEAASQLKEWITKIEKQGLKPSHISDLRALMLAWRT